jgi:hypothetical protein
VLQTQSGAAETILPALLLWRRRVGRAGRIQRDLMMVAVLAALAFGPLGASEVKAQSFSDTGAVRIKGAVTAPELDVHQATLADVMTALRRFNIRCQSSVALNDAVSGTYAGSLDQVLSRVLDGYNYTIRHKPNSTSSSLAGVENGRRPRR